MNTHIDTIKKDLDKRGVEYQSAVQAAVAGQTDPDEITESTLKALAGVVARLDTTDFEKSGEHYRSWDPDVDGDDNLIIAEEFLHDGFVCCVKWIFSAAEVDAVTYDDDAPAYDDLDYDVDHLYAYKLETVGKDKYNSSDVDEITDWLYA